MKLAFKVNGKGEQPIHLSAGDCITVRDLGDDQGRYSIDVEQPLGHESVFQHYGGKAVGITYRGGPVPTRMLGGFRGWLARLVHAPELDTLQDSLETESRRWAVTEERRRSLLVENRRLRSALETIRSEVHDTVGSGDYEFQAEDEDDE